jgi:hypothetical protein
MNTQKKQSESKTSGGLKEALVAVDNEIERLLRENRIYDVLGYGWSGPDTPSDEYVGLAMWLLTPPFEADTTALSIEGNAISYAPTERDEVLLLNGEDFLGTMDFARHSIGVALCYASAENQKYKIFGRAPFWHALATGLLWLNIASDRLRDLFLMAWFKQDKDAYAKSYKNSNQGKTPPFAAPFEEALKSASTDKKQQQILDAAFLLAKELQSYRNDRNVIVHKIASKGAEVSIDILKEQRELARTGKAVQFSKCTVEELIAAEEADPTIPTAIARMNSWYACLVKAGSLIFESEYWKRIADSG